MCQRLLHWLFNRPRRLKNLRGRFAARAIVMAFPELLTVDPVNDLTHWFFKYNWIP